MCKKSLVERVDADDYFERMCKAVSKDLEQRDGDEDDIISAIDSLVAEKEREDSQINRFLNFLDDEALARIRLTITFRIMEAIAQNAATANQTGHQLLAEYVNRVLTLCESAKENDYPVDLTAHFGIAADFNLQDYLSKATFYSCLPVWAEWKTQIFEEKVTNETATSHGVVREVSYRFRVNGQNPELGKAAFEARLEKIEEDLLENEETSPPQAGKICRRLAELIFLAVVIPRNSQVSLSKETLPNSVNQLLSLLQLQGKDAVKKVLRDLKERAKSMESIATALISILRIKSQKIIAQVQRSSSQQFICVKRDIIEWSRLEGAEAGVRDLLVGPQQRSREQVKWFENIEICDRPETPGLLFSVKVSAELSEYNLAIKGKADSIQLQRLFPQKILQVCWVPASSQKGGDNKWEYKFSESTKSIRQVVKNAKIEKELVETLKLTDPNAQEWVGTMVRHLLVLGYGLGWTAMRECLKHNRVRKTKLEAIWCPLTLPGQVSDRDEEKEKTARTFQAAFNLTGQPDLALVDQGQPGRADFLLWLSTDEKTEGNFTSQSAKFLTRKENKPLKFENLILCLEFSFQRASKAN